jgi:arsenite methyltransferase
MTQLKVTHDGASRDGATGARGRAPDGESPLVVAALRPGDVVLELGCGLGFDTFLAARQVGLTGDVIGIDPSPELVARARANARAVAALNVTFLRGELAQLPVPDRSIDVIVSSQTPVATAADGALREACRALRDGGRLAIRVVVAGEPGVAGYRARALRLAELRATLRAAGFDAVTFHGSDDHATTAVAIKAAEHSGPRPESWS